MRRGRVMTSPPADPSFQCDRNRDGPVSACISVRVVPPKMNSWKRGWPKAPATSRSAPGRRAASSSSRRRRRRSPVRTSTSRLHAARGVDSSAAARDRSCAAWPGARRQHHHLARLLPAAAWPARAARLASLPPSQATATTPPTLRPARRDQHRAAAPPATICWKASTSGPRPRAGSAANTTTSESRPPCTGPTRPGMPAQRSVSWRRSRLSKRAAGGSLALGGRLLQRLQRGHLHAAHEALAHPGHQVGDVGRRVDTAPARPRTARRARRRPRATASSPGRPGQRRHDPCPAHRSSSVPDRLRLISSRLILCSVLGQFTTLAAVEERTGDERAAHASNASTPRAWQRMLSGRRLDLLDPSPARHRDRGHRPRPGPRGALERPDARRARLLGRPALAWWSRRSRPTSSPGLEPRWRLAALLHDAPEYVIGDMISPVQGGARRRLQDLRGAAGDAPSTCASASRPRRRRRSRR